MRYAIYAYEFDKRTRPLTTQPGPQLGVEAGTGSLKMASTCGDGYAR